MKPTSGGGGDVAVGLPCFNAPVEFLTHLDAVEVVEDGAIKSLDEAFGLGRSHRGATMVDSVGVQVEVVGMPCGTVEGATVVGEDGFDGESALGIQGQRVVV